MRHGGVVIESSVIELIISWQPAAASSEQWFQRRPRRRGQPGRRRDRRGEEGGGLARRPGQDVPLMRLPRAVWTGAS
jgi:hypothetical protein